MLSLSERLRYIKLRGNLIRQGDEWVWIAAPDCQCAIREVKDKSRWVVVDWTFDMLKEIKL